MNIINKPIPVFVFYAILFSILYSLGGFILSDGWGRIDSSPHRDLLYKLFFLINPAVFGIGIIHCVSTIITKPTAKKSAIFAFFFGFLGPLLLHIAIVYSDDGVAAMAYIAATMSYFIFALIGFIISCISLVLIPIIKGAPNNTNSADAKSHTAD